MQNWNLFRLVRLVGGLGLLVYGISVVDWPFIIIGTMIGWMAIANSGCSPFSNTCEVPQKEVKKNESELLEDNK